MNKYTTKDFHKEFPNDDVCLEWIKKQRWPKGIHCSVCDKITKHHKVRNRKCYECDNCGNQVYPTAGTIFHKSATPLTMWFEVIFRMASTRCGVSAKQIQRETGVTYKTAWRMFKQIRTLFDDSFPKLTGEVEADETYIGGKRSGRRGRGASGKTIVLGAAERKGSVVTRIAPDVKAKTINPFLVDNISPDATIITDEFHSYDRVAQFFYGHERINHLPKVYVVGNVHTNTIEGFWSLVKRGINGVYHAVSPKYLQSYVNEYSFRYNHRNDETPMFQTFLSRISSRVEKPS